MLNAIASIGNMVGNLGSLGYNIYSGERNLQYQKQLQERIFNREDTAVQRRKADMIAAGFNPVLAAGDGAGSGSVVQTVAPQVVPNNLGDALLSPFKTGAEVDKLKAEEKSINQGVEKMLHEIKQIDSQTLKNNTETILKTLQQELTKEEIKKINAEIRYIEENIFSKKLQNEYDDWQNTFWRFSGFPPQLANSPLTSLATLIASGIKNKTIYSVEEMKKYINSWSNNAKENPQDAVKEVYEGKVNQDTFDRATNWIYGK